MEQTKIKYKSFYGDPKTFFCQSLKFDIISCGKETLGKRNNQKKIEVVKDETVITKLVHLSKGLGNYISHYDNILFLGDFNSQPSEINDLWNTSNFSNLVKEPTCFKIPDNPSCIDLFLTSRPKCFQRTMKMETGISDFHEIVNTVLKIFYKKHKPKII